MIQALPFLIASTREVMGLEESAEYPLTDIKGKRVVVLGGEIRRWTVCAPPFAAAQRA